MTLAVLIDFDHFQKVENLDLFVYCHAHWDISIGSSSPTDAYISDIEYVKTTLPPAFFVASTSPNESNYEPTQNYARLPISLIYDYNATGP